MENEAQSSQRRWKGRSRKTLWIVGALAAVLLVLLTVGLLTEWFGLYGPLTKVALGAKKLGDAGSTTVQFSLTANGGTQVEGSLACRWSMENRAVVADLQMQLNGNDYHYGLVDGYLVWRTASGKAKSIDISDELDRFFDSMESESDLDESLAELLESVFKTAGIEKMVETQDAVTCMKKGIFQWNRTDWLRENAGYTQEKEGDTTRYRFEPKTGKLLLAILRQFEPAFHHRSDYLDVISGLRELKPQLNEDYGLKIGFSLSDGTLTQINADVDWKETQVSAQIRFENIGTTDVDMRALRQIKDESYN